jgi:type IV secretory pathway ATPase VirB11/archaellum biosynthesis ATPase
MPDGSFLEISYDYGFQIRKMKTKFTPEFLIKNKFATPAALAFLDSIIKHNKSILIVGPKDSGKSTFLSGLLNMVGKNKVLRIIEKEPHIVINNLNWSSTITSISKKDPREVVENYLRARPDFIVIDEMDGKYAKFILHGLDLNPAIITFDAGNTDVAINRIVNKFRVPKAFLANIDVIVMLNHMRNIEEILEIHRYEKDTNEIKAKVVFRKEHGKLRALESRFMRVISDSKKHEMRRTAKKLHALSKK